MTHVTRRQAMQALAVGVAAAGTGAISTATRADATDPYDTDEAAFAAAQRLGAYGEPRACITALATIGHCRSWDSSVYLDAGPSIRGFVRLSPQGFALAAAAQVAGRAVFVRCWGHDPRALGGVGEFEGAHVALEERDFPSLPATPRIA